MVEEQDPARKSGVIMNVAVMVAAAIIGFTIAAGPALVVTLMDMGKEKAAKDLKTASTETVATPTRDNELINV